MDLLFPFYTIIDVWDDWPESSITDISNAKFASMESGGFKVLKKENVDLGGINVSKQYYSNPSRDNDYQWDHVGVNYVSQKRIQIIVLKFITSQPMITTTKLILKS